MSKHEDEFRHNCEYWLIAIPLESSDSGSWDKLVGIGRKYAEVHKFNIPDLRVGTLDLLLAASSDLERLENYVHGILIKLVDTLLDVQEGNRKLVEDNLLIEGHSLHSYISRFRWETAKYPIRHTIKGIEELIEKQIYQIEYEMKNKHQAYNKARQNLAIIERNETGTLVTRNVADLVKKEDFVLNSNHLITVLVVVAKAMYKDWYNCYERLDDEVIPRSTSLIAEDGEYGLFNVTLFKRHLENFTSKAKEKKFFVKDFVYDEIEIERKRHHYQELVTEKALQHGPLIRWLRINFSEVYIALTHVKAMRIFVESVLRFGLPVNFISVVMFVPKKHAKRLKDQLHKEYSYLDAAVPFGGGPDSEEPDVAGFDTADYYPFVFFTIQAELKEFR